MIQQKCLMTSMAITRVFCLALNLPPQGDSGDLGLPGPSGEKVSLNTTLLLKSIKISPIELV